METPIFSNNEMAAQKAKLILKSSGLQLITPKFFAFNTSQMATEQAEYEIAKEDVTGNKRNFFGQPIFDAIYFPPFSYTDPETGKAIKNAGVIIDTALIEINQTKNIVTTAIQGRKGTVKEYINEGDFEVTITGMLVAKESNVPPRQLMHDMNEIKKAPVTLDVACNFLDAFEIYSVVVKDVKFGQIEGTRNAVLFSMNCLSDVPYEIQQNKNQVIVKKSKAMF